MLIYGRLEMYGDAFLARCLQASARAAATKTALTELRDRYQIGWTLQ
jgi:hypothetical protein